jgi:hypothetical protein
MEAWVLKIIHGIAAEIEAWSAQIESASLPPLRHGLHDGALPKVLSAEVENEAAPAASDLSDGFQAGDGVSAARDISPHTEPSPNGRGRRD